MKIGNDLERAQNWEAILLTTAPTACCMVAKKILFLAANPQGTGRLRLDQEVRDVDEGLRRSQQRAQFELQQRWAVRPRDVQRAMLDLNPQIVHFSGHGEGSEFVGEADRSQPIRRMELDEDLAADAIGGLVFEDDAGNPTLISGRALAGLFGLFTDYVECVVLNGCYSATQAEAIAQQIPYVIGMTKAIGDRAAIEFAVGFYDALGAGRSIEDAYKLGCVAIQMAGIAEHLTPVLLQKKVEGSGKLWNVPELPPHFLDRSDALNGLKAKVLTSVQSDEMPQAVVMTSASRQIGVQGMGGIGKSVLAAALAHDVQVRQAFPDGVFWVAIGQEPSLTGLQVALAKALGEDQPTFSTVQQGQLSLRELWVDKTALLILDDVWQVEHAAAFEGLGATSKLLVTTRDARLITALGATAHALDLLEDGQAIELLANWAEQPVETLPPAAYLVMRECGHLPLALAMVGAMVQGKPDRWENVLHKLRSADLGKIRQQFPGYPYADLLKTIQVSVEALEPAEQERYLEFAVFPEDTPIPEAVLQTFWRSAGLEWDEVQDVIYLLVDLSLARRDEQGNLSLHDLQVDYVRKQVMDLPGLHDRLLGAYAIGCPGGWHQGTDDGYFFEHLALHLREAGRQMELRELLFQFEWLRAKLAATDVNGLLADFAQAPKDTELNRVKCAIRLSAHVFAKDKTQLPSQLSGRLLSFETPTIQTLLNQIAQQNTVPWLCCLTPSLTPPGGALIRTLEGHEGWVTAVCLTPDGKQAVSASHDSTLKVWDIGTGTLIRTLEGHTDCVTDCVKNWVTRWVTAVCLTLDGKQVVSASNDSTLKVWDIGTGTLIRTLEGYTDAVRAVCLTPDGKQVVSASEDNTLKVWDIGTGTLIRTLEGHTDWVNAVCLTPDGKQVVSASDDKTLKVWDIGTGTLIRTLEGHTEGVNAVCLTPDGKQAVSASEDNTLKVWDIGTGTLIRTLEGHTEGVNAVCLTPDGKQAVSASYDSTLKVWDIGTGTLIKTLEAHTASVNSVCLTPDGNQVVSASTDHTLKVWDISIGTLIRRLEAHTASVNSVCLTPNGEQVVSTSKDHTLKVWNIETGNLIRTLEGYTDAVYAICLTPDGNQVVCASEDHTLKVLDISTGALIRTLEAHTATVYAICLTPDSNQAIFASKDNTLKVWDISTDTLIKTLEGHTGEVTAVCFTPDGHQVVSASKDNTLKVWDISTGTLIRTLEGYTATVYAICLTPDGNQAISASKDNTLKVWDISTGTLIRTLEGYTAWVKAVCLTPDGKQAVSASDDATLKVWDIASGQLITSFQGDSAMRTCTIAPDGVTIAAGDESGRVHFLRLEGV
jgi:WD40 repeat protein